MMQLREICRIAQKVGLLIDVEKIGSPEKASKALRTLQLLESRGMR